MECIRIIIALLTTSIFLLILFLILAFLNAIKPLLLIARTLFGIDVSPLVSLLVFIILILALLLFLDICTRRRT